MRRSELLRRAEAYLWDGFLHGDGERFLCLAIRGAADDLADDYGPHEFDDVTGVAEGLRAWICEELLGLPTEVSPSLEGWLEVEHGIDPNSDLVKLQATRRAWLAWMVRYWQERGQ